MTGPLLCYSCRQWRKDGCAVGRPGWPNQELSKCAGADYEPGTSPSEFDSYDEYLKHASGRNDGGAAQGVAEFCQTSGRFFGVNGQQKV